MEATSSDAGKILFSHSALGSTVIGGMHQFFKEGKFVDCVLISSDTKSFSCHRVILSSASPILHEALTQHESSFPCVILSEVSSSDLCLLVEYIYKGKVAVPEDRIEGFKKAGEKLQISGFGKDKKLKDTPSLQAPVLIETSVTSGPQLMDESPAPSQSQIFSFAAKVGLEVVRQQLFIEQLASAQQSALKLPVQARFDCQHCSKSYKSVYSRNYHHLKCDQNPNPISGKCSNCDAPLKPSAYKIHIKKCSAIHSRAPRRFTVTRE